MEALQLNINIFFISRALEVWGSQEALLEELVRKEVERKIYQQSKYISLYIQIVFTLIYRCTMKIFS